LTFCVYLFDDDLTGPGRNLF